MSKTAKIFSAAVIAVALVATVTVAKTIHPLTAATEVDRTVGTTGMAPRDSAPAFGQRGAIPVVPTVRSTSVAAVSG